MAGEGGEREEGEEGGEGVWSDGWLAVSSQGVVGWVLVVFAGASVKLYTWLCLDKSVKLCILCALTEWSVSSLLDNSVNLRKLCPPHSVSNEPSGTLPAYLCMLLIQ